MIILLVLVPFNHERDIYKNSDPQYLKIPCCYEATRNLEVWGQVDEEYNVLVCLEILRQLSSLIVENFLRCY